MRMGIPIPMHTSRVVMLRHFDTDTTVLNMTLFHAGSHWGKTTESVHYTNWPLSAHVS